MEASIYRMRHQDVLAVCVVALLSLGVVMVQSASTSLSGSVVRAPSPDPDAPQLPGPDRVGDLRAATGTGGIDLSWRYDSDASVVGYRVFRSESADGEYALVETVKKPATQYHDAAAPVGRPAFYKVAAVDDMDMQGASAALSAVRPSVWTWTQLGSRHLTYVVVAFLAFMAVGYVPYWKLAGGVDARAEFWKSPVVWATALAGLACVAVLVPGVGSTVNGARRWIKLGPIQIQPSELAKWAAVLFLAWWLTRPATRTEQLVRGFLPAVAPVAALCLLVVIQDFGTAALIGLCAMTMLLAGRVKWWHVAAIALPAALAGVWFITHKEYRLRRIMAFRDPYASPQGEGYHMIQSLLSFSTGGLLGRGLGNGIQKLGYLPEDTTDFIFAVICEELGLFGALLDRRSLPRRAVTSPGRWSARSATTSAGCSPSASARCSASRRPSTSPSRR